MKKNVCGLDRIARLLVGTALLLSGLRSLDDRNDRDGTITVGQILSFYAGADLLVTGYMQWCPTNYALGIDTCERDPGTLLRRAAGREPRSGSEPRRKTGAH